MNQGLLHVAESALLGQLKSIIQESGYSECVTKVYCYIVTFCCESENIEYYSSWKVNNGHSEKQQHHFLKTKNTTL